MSSTVATETASQCKLGNKDPYPSAVEVLGRFVHFMLVQQCLVGAALVYGLIPFYEQTRIWAHRYQISDAFYFTIIASFVVHTGTYVLVNLPYFLLDTFQLYPPAKLFRKPFMNPTKDQLVKLGLDQLVSQLIVTPLSIYYVAYPFLFQPFLLDLDASVPQFWGHTSFTMFVYAVSNDFLFYAAHRWLHTPVWYKRVHKQHHEFVGSVGYAAEYAHPFEGLLANQLPTFSGLVWMQQTHPLCFLVYLMLRLQQTYEAHSGYCFFPNSPTWQFLLTKSYETAHHDAHHAHNQGNFGVFYVDWIFGTMRSSTVESESALHKSKK